MEKEVIGDEGKWRLCRVSPWWPGDCDPSPSPARPPSRDSRSASRRLMMMSVTVMVIMQVVPCCSFDPRCFPEGGTSYCLCAEETMRSGPKLSIKCDFQKKEAVLLTENLYPFRGSRAVGASVLLANATSVRVTAGFLRAWLGITSVALDLWNCGRVTLAAAPLVHVRHPLSFSTFVGLGVMGCTLPEVPAGLLRNRGTASLKIKNSEVGILRRNLFDNVRKIKYLVVEDSVVEQVEGPVAKEGYFTLSQLDTHRWNGLVLTNVTIQTLGAGAFNLTHKTQRLENTHKVVVRQCRVGRVGAAALTVTGDIAVTIKQNVFETLEDEAFKIDVTRDLKFEENTIQWAGERALLGLKCHNFTKLDKNLINFKSVQNRSDLSYSSVLPFPTSCRHSQVFRVVDPSLPQVMQVASQSTWVLLGVLLVLLALAAASLLCRVRVANTQGDASSNNFQFNNGITSAARYRANQQEVNMMMQDIQVGVSNPLYDRYQYRSSL